MKPLILNRWLLPLLLTCNSAKAADGTWTDITAGPNNWSNSLMWSGGTIADASGFTATFSSNITGTTTVTLDSARTIGNLTFSDNGASGSAWVLSGSNALTLAGGSTSTITATTAATIGTRLSGTNSLTKAGSAVLTLSATNNNYSGGTIINSGELRASVGTIATGTYTTLGSGSVTANSGSTLRFFAGSTTNTYTYANAINLNSATLAYEDGNHVLTGGVALTGTNTITGVWSGKTLKISGVVSGTGSISHGGFSTLILSGTNTYSGGTTLTGGTVQVLNASAFGTGSVSVTGSSTLTASAAFATNIAVNSGVTLSLNGGFVNLNGVISGAGNVTAIDSIQLRGTNTYTGKTAVSGGFLCIDREANLGATPASFTADSLTLSGGGSLSNYLTASAITLSANRGITLASGNTGVFDISGGVMTINGVITGAGKLSKGGANNLILAAANTYTGGTTLSAGTLTVNNATGLSTTSVIVTGNSTLSIGTSISNNIAINSGITLSINGGFINLNGVISGAGNLTATNSIQVRGTNTYTGKTLVTGGFLCIDREANLGATPASFTADSLTLSGGGCLSNYLATAPTVLSANRGITLSASNTGGFDVGGQTLTVQGVITGAGNLIKLSSGELIVTGNNTFTGKSSISVGKLTVSTIKNVGDTTGSSLGNVADATAGTIALGSGTNTVALNYTGIGSTTDRVINLSGTTGAASITQSGTGLLKFTSAMTATGAGIKTLTLDGSTAGSGEIAGAIVDNSGTNKTSVTKSGTGTWTLSGTSTYTGATTVSAGTLLVSGALGNTPVTVSNGATLTNNGTIGGTITTGSTGTVNGTGTFTGAVTINGALNPGNSPGFQSYGDSLTLGSSAITTIELGGLSRSTLLSSGTGYYDAIDVATTLMLDGTINVSWFGGFTATQGDSFNLFDATTFNSSGFTIGTDLVLPTLETGLTWDTSTFTTNGVISVVPEPSAALLGAIGLLALLRRRR